MQQRLWHQTVLVMLVALLCSCASELVTRHERLQKFARREVVLPPGHIRLWRDEISLGFESELRFEKAPDWVYYIETLSPTIVDRFVKIGLASVSEDLGFPIESWVREHVYIWNGRTDPETLKAFAQERERQRSLLSPPEGTNCGLDWRSSTLEGYPRVLFRYCSPKSGTYFQDEGPPLARELVKLDAERGAYRAYRFYIETFGAVAPDPVDPRALRFNISILVGIDAKGRRADERHFTRVEHYDTAQAEKLRKLLAQRVLQAYLREWKKRGAEVQFDDSSL